MILLGILNAQAEVADAGSYDLLETTILASDASEVTFTSLNSTYASTYKHLQLRLTTRVDSATGGIVSAAMRFQDTGSNYSWHRLRGEGGSVTSDGSSSQNYMYYGRVPRDGFASNAYWGGVIDILDPFSTTKNTTIRSLGGIATDSVNFFSGAWLSTSAVDEIEVEGSPGVGLKAGSRISLYGIKAA